MIAPHEEQARRNHDQSLQRLAERGGLTADEALAILEDRRHRDMPIVEANEAICRLIECWNRRAEHTPSRTEG